MTEAEIKALQDRNALLEQQAKESQSRIASMETEQHRVLAAATVRESLTEAGITFNPKLVERACQNPVVKEGKLDQDWIKGIVSDFSDGHTAKVTGHGRSKESEDTTQGNGLLKEAEAKELWKELGVPEAGLRHVMGGVN